MFFGFLHILVMRKIKKSQKDFCEQEINYVTRIESSSNMEDQSDEDIEINVEKGVVYVSISDKLLFRSGSYTVIRFEIPYGSGGSEIVSKPFHFLQSPLL